MAILHPGAKRVRQQTILNLVEIEAIHSQEELAERLAERGFHVTQATVSRDVAELGLLKVPRGGAAAYVRPEAFEPPPGPLADERLRRQLESIPLRIGRSGLILVLRGPAGSAQALARAIDQSTLTEAEGTLAGDDTVLVLFADDDSLRRWLARFRRLQGLEVSPSGDPTAPIP